MDVLDIQVICSDPQVHQRRVETRSGDIAGLVPPTWQSVLDHEYEAWDEAPWTLDTALLTVNQAVTLVIARLASTGLGNP